MVQLWFSARYEPPADIQKHFTDIYNMISSYRVKWGFKTKAYKNMMLLNDKFINAVSVINRTSDFPNSEDRMLACYYMDIPDVEKFFKLPSKEPDKKATLERDRAAILLHWTSIQEFFKFDLIAHTDIYKKWKASRRT
jgi:hypothetical protein